MRFRVSDSDPGRRPAVPGESRMPKKEKRFNGTEVLGREHENAGAHPDHPCILKLPCFFFPSLLTFKTKEGITRNSRTCRGRPRPRRERYRLAQASPTRRKAHEARRAERETSFPSASKAGKYKAETKIKRWETVSRTQERNSSKRKTHFQFTVKGTYL